MKKKTKQINEQYRKEIRRLIDKTEDTHALCCTYTTILTHLKILAEKGGAADEQKGHSKGNSRRFTE